MEPASLTIGTHVLIVGLQGRADLNGRRGTVCGAFDEASGRVPVKVALPRLRDSESVRIKPANLQAGSAEPTFQVVRTQCTRGNTGFGGGLGQVLSSIYASRGQSDSPLIVEERRRCELETIISERKYIEHPTPLCEQFGLHLHCYAQPYRSSDEHQGRNNILATFLTNDAQSGLAPETVLGDAIFVRRSPTTGELVDFVWSEAARALFYINDLSEVYPLEEWCPSHCDRTAYFDTIRQCFPYYMANDAGCDNMRRNGFVSSDNTRECRRMPDGTLRLRPADMQRDAEFIKIQ